jgi:hypothetical protein
VANDQSPEEPRGERPSKCEICDGQLEDGSKLTAGHSPGDPHLREALQVREVQIASAQRQSLTIHLRICYGVKKPFKCRDWQWNFQTYKIYVGLLSTVQMCSAQQRLLYTELPSEFH